MSAPRVALEPPTGEGSWPAPEPGSLDDFETGFLLGILVGEGHFGGDGRQPQVTLRMHTDHEALFRWLAERHPAADCTARITTAVAATTSGWRAGRASGNASCRCSKRG